MRRLTRILLLILILCAGVALGADLCCGGGDEEKPNPALQTSPQITVLPEAGGCCPSPESEQPVSSCGCGVGAETTKTLSTALSAE